MKFLKKINRLLFDPDARFDLFVAFPRFYTIFFNQRVHSFAQQSLGILLIILVLAGLFGPQEPLRNVMLYLCWGIWWPSVVLSLLFVGRMWCGICPFPLAGRFFQSCRLSLEKNVPKLIIKNSNQISVVFFMIIIWVEESTGMKESPKETAWLLIVIWAGATFCALLFSKQRWCQYFCPLGRLMAIGATISLLEFRADPKVCRQCTTFSCNKGTEKISGCPVSLGAFKVNNNLNCLVCGHCLQLCPHNSPQLNIRHPLSELTIRKGKLITSVLMITFLMGSQLARFMDHNILNLMEDIESVCMHNGVCQMGLYAIPLVFGYVIVHVTISYGDLFCGVYHDGLRGSFSPMLSIFLPLAFAGELVSRMNYSIRNLPEFFPTLGRQFGLETLQYWTISIPEWVYPAYGIFFVFLSEVAGLYLLQRFYIEECEGVVSRWKYHAVQAAFFALFGIYLSLMSTGWNIPSLNVMLLFQ